MGSLSAMSSMKRVLELHRVELIQELKDKYPSPLIKTHGVELSDGCYGLTPFLILTDDTEIELAELTIDELAERFADAEVGY